MQPLALPIYRVSLVQEGAVRYEQQMRSSASVARLLEEYLKGADREYFVVILLDQKNRLIGINTAFIGSLTGSLIHPRKIFKPAFLSNAAAIVLGHNHSSGDTEPRRSSMYGPACGSGGSARRRGA